MIRVEGSLGNESSSGGTLELVGGGLFTVVTIKAPPDKDGERAMLASVRVPTRDLYRLIAAIESATP